jgi:hypothetical protein
LRAFLDEPFYRTRETVKTFSAWSESALIISPVSLSVKGFGFGSL